MSSDPLAVFHPLVAEWFREEKGEPTAVQAETWARVARGEHVLAVAPTGSGKTLAAFLHAISRLVSGELPAGGLSVLYVSPLKALNEDIRRNLESPLGELALRFRGRGAAFPAIRVETRSGDTPEADRRRFLTRPPAILCTTPESLAILLDSPRARPILAGVRLLVLDEVHAVAGNKRGSLLACSVGRLALLAGEFQRVALSATVRPPEAAADFVGGLRLLPPDGSGTARRERRPVAVVAPYAEKRLSLSVEWPEAAPLGPAGLAGAEGAAAAEPDATRYAAVVPAIASRLKEAKSVIVFCDARRRAERLAFLLNEREGPGTAYAHHGSLSKEARRGVEERLKSGELKCVAATASLELGIDVGSVEEVILAGSPPEIAAALQRLGRSGHGVGEASRGVLYPFNGMDLLLAAAVAKGVEERAVEELRVPESPLDILAQVLLEMAAEGPWKIDALYEAVTCFRHFEGLSRASFDSVLEMLAGRYADSRVRELEPRLYLDRATGTARAREGVRALLYSSGGSIPDRGLYAMRLKGSGAKIGELDEEFVWERKAGDAFTLGSQSWRIVEIGAEAVTVAPLGRGADFMPFWKGQARYRSAEASDRLLATLERLGKAGEAEGARLLAAERGFSEAAAAAASRFAAAQKAAQKGAVLPGPSSVALESYADPARRGDSRCLVLYTLRGGAVNEPLALALAEAWEEAFGLSPDAMADDDSVLLIVPEEGGAAGVEGSAAARLQGLIRSLAEGKRLESLLRRRLEGSGVFGAQFRENAGRALLLPKGLPGKRVPLWITRLRSKRLFEATRGYADFPVTAETWRSCLADLFDLPRLRGLLEGIASGRIEVGAFETRAPSPFAREALWRETNEYLYRGDALGGKAASSLGDAAIEAALRSSRLRPRLDPDLVAGFVRKLKRLLPGWGPSDPLELAEWIKERVLVPAAELPGILAAADPSCVEALRTALAEDAGLGGRVLALRLEGASEEVLVHAERLGALRSDPAALVAEWMRREGPVPADKVAALFGLPLERIEDLFEELEEEGAVVLGDFGEEGGPLRAVDAENLESLLRLSRRAARPSVEARPAKDLFRLVAAVQELRAGPAPSVPAGAGPEDARSALERALDRLAGYSGPASLWESEFLPARVPGYSPSLLDAALSAEPRLWFGTGRERLAFARAEELELFAKGGASRLVPPDSPPLDFWELKERAGLSSKELALALWAEAWKGLAGAEGFEAVRKGLAGRFGRDLPDAVPAEAAPEPFGARRRVPRALRERWKAGAPVAGRWFALDLGPDEGDALDEEELERARVRVLARRYGLLARPLLERELPLLGWGALFPAMRRMELAGELLYGRFFEGLDGPQFMSPEAFELWKGLGNPAAGGEGPVWLSALDPASPAGFPFQERPGLLPPRALSARLCLSGGEVVASSLRSGKELRIGPEPGDPAAAAIVSGIAPRSAGPRAARGRVVLETVNGQAAARSPYAALLAAAGFEADRGRMTLW
ncbi:MAG TPA: DEAD/DEAH box helicase [Spirochaetia bacterium]|nr:DEAD/DEAH box helicase [Spirochaetia bacterium]